MTFLCSSDVFLRLDIKTMGSFKFKDVCEVCYCRSINHSIFCTFVYDTNRYLRLFFDGSVPFHNSYSP